MIKLARDNRYASLAVGSDQHLVPILQNFLSKESKICESKRIHQKKDFRRQQSLVLATLIHRASFRKKLLRCSVQRSFDDVFAVELRHLTCTLRLDLQFL